MSANALFPPPPGYVVDLANPQRTNHIAAYWCFGVGVFFSLLFTAQRAYVKIVLKIPWRLDDTLLAISWVTSMSVQALLLREFILAIVGVHIWEIEAQRFAQVYMSVWIAAPIYVLAGTCTKLALLVFYLRVSPQLWLRYTVFAATFIIVGYSTGIFFALIFACTPIRKSFDIMVPANEGHCISSAALYIATAVCNIVSDVMLFALPMPMIFGLQMPWKQKLQFFFVFGIGSITVVTSIIRAAILPQMLTTTDVTWDVSLASLLIIIESNLIIICGMLPTLQKFFRIVAPKLIGEVTCGQHAHGDGTPPKLLARGFRSPNKKRGSSNDSPHLVTFGSLPVKARGYARFGDGQNPYEYPLTTMNGDVDDDRVRASRESGRNGGGASVGARVVAGREGCRDSVGEVVSSKPSSAGSQAPIVTTRIEVSYGRSGEAFPRKGTGTSF